MLLSLSFNLSTNHNSTQHNIDHKPQVPAEAARIRALGGVVRPDQMSGRLYRVCKVFGGGGYGALAVSRSLGDFGWSPFISDEPYVHTVTLPERVCCCSGCGES